MRKVLIFCAMAVVAMLLPMIASSDLDKGREVRLVVRDMTFYLEGQDQPNPTLRFRAGEKVRLVLKNEDAGMDHDFTVAQWDVRTKMLEGKGEDAVVFRVPRTRVTDTYQCSPHAKMMRGTLVVE